jgi:hypothetical protein
LLSVVLLLAVALAVTPLVDRHAATDCEQLFQRAFITFALARTINGVISVVQGTEVALQPAGVGVTLTPGEILDPVNDLVERFSWIMLGATISLGVQNVLLEVSAWWLIQGLVALLAAWLVIRLWYPAQGGRVSLALLNRVFLLLLFIRFAVPVMLIANDMVYQLFLESRYQESTEVITVAGRELEQLSRETSTQSPAAGEGGVLDAIANAWNSTVDAVDIAGRFEHLRARAGAIIEHLVQLSVVFILQTALLPVAFLWIFLQVFRRLFKSVRQ